MRTLVDRFLRGLSANREEVAAPPPLRREAGVFAPAVTTGSRLVEEMGGGRLYVVTQFRYHLTSGSGFITSDHPLTEAEIAVYEAQARAREQQYQRERAALFEAEKKAFALLMEFLSPIQRKQYQRSLTFIARGKSGQRYLIESNQRVRAIDSSGEAIASYCIIPNSLNRLPPSDIMLAQKLIIEHDEKKFLQVANYSPVYRR